MNHRGKVAAALAAVAVLCGAHVASAATTAFVTAPGKNINALIPIDVDTHFAGAPITIGALPYAVVPSSDGGTLYVTSQGKVTKVDVSTGATAGWAVGKSTDTLKDAVLSKDGKTLWVADWDGNAVFPVDTTTGQAGAAIPTGAWTSGMTLSADGSTVYAIAYMDKKVSRIDTATRTVVGTPITLPSNAYRALLTPDGKTLIVATATQLVPIDLATWTAGTAIPFTGSAWDIELGPDGKTAYITGYSAGTITPLDLATMKLGTPIAAGPNPQFVAFAPGGKTMWATNYSALQITPIDLATGKRGNAMSIDGMPTQVLFLDHAAPTPFLGLSDARLAGRVGDPSNPTVQLQAEVPGVDAADITVTAASSSNASVLPAANVKVAGTGMMRTVSALPTGIGYADITLRLTAPGGVTTSTVLHYASSAAPATATSRILSSLSDASAAVDAGDGYMLVANDEDNVIRLYKRGASGGALRSWDWNRELGTTKEIDFEAAAGVGDTIYWTGSMSNDKSAKLAPDRSKLLATKITGSGASTDLTFTGVYTGLRADLLAWDHSGGDRLGLTAAAAAGVNPKTNGGFNAEALEFAPGSTSTAYLGFRAPIVGGKALIVPVTNADQLPGGAGAVHATFGDGIWLDLGGLGIRDIRKNAHDQYVILAGQATEGGPQALYVWDGNPAHAPARTDTPIAADNDGSAEPASWEGIVSVPDQLVHGSQVELVMDNGTVDLYKDGDEAKKLKYPSFKVSRDDVFTVVFPHTDTSGIVGGDVPATLALQLGAQASFGAFTPGVAKHYTAATTATVTSTAGDATLTATAAGHLANGAFTLPSPLQIAFSKSSWDGPASNDAVTVGFAQPLAATDALRTGTYATSVTFTLSTTTP
jgi:DNA-binding beta-propeller fold protein YncE